MAAKTEHAEPPAVVRVIELVGVSSKSWSDAAQQAGRGPRGPLPVNDVGAEQDQIFADESVEQRQTERRKYNE